MGWVKIEAPVTDSKGVTLALAVGKGSARLIVSVPSALARQHGWDGFDRCTVMLGTDTHAGRMMLRPATDGELKLTRLKYAVYVRVPEQRGWPGKSVKFGAAAATWDGGDLTITLPPVLLGSRQAADVMASKTVTQAKAGAPAGFEIIGSIVSFRGKQKSFTAQQMNILRLLAAHWAKPVSREAVMTHLYGDDPNGGPETDRTVDVVLSRIRQVLPLLGLMIVNHSGQGWALCEQPRAKAAE